MNVFMHLQTPLDGWQNVPAVSIALQHSSLLCADVLCRLLCVSRATRSMVWQHCAGLVSVGFKVPRSKGNVRKKRQMKQKLKCCKVKDQDIVQQIGRWISQHGRLLSSMVIKDTLKDTHESSLTNTIAACLSTPASQGHLKLRSLSLECSDATGHILEQLSPQFLTGLDITWVKGPTENQRIADAFTQLTGLQQLTMMTWWRAAPPSGSSLLRGSSSHAGTLVGFAYMDPMIPALAPLASLTSLELKSEVMDRSLLKQLPPQLQELVVSFARIRSYLVDYPPGATAPLQLAHLTALTRLVCRECLIVHEDDVLPISLKVLNLDDCLSCQPLLKLQQLQEIIMGTSTTPAEELLQLSQLTALTKIILVYEAYGRRGITVAADAAAAWVALPGLQVLGFGDFLNEAWVTIPILQSLKQVSSLVRLSVCNMKFSQQSVNMLPAVLQQLTALTALQLEILYQGGDESTSLQPGQQVDTVTVQVDEVLACSIARLPKLLSLHLEELHISGSPAALALAEATQLTSLSITYSRLNDALVLTLLQDMHTLQHLDLHDNRQIKDASGPAIARLTQLTGLYLDQTAMYWKGLQWLSRLHRLQDCILPMHYQWDAVRKVVVPACAQSCSYHPVAAPCSQMCSVCHQPDLETLFAME